MGQSKKIILERGYEKLSYQIKYNNSSYKEIISFNTNLVEVSIQDKSAGLNEKRYFVVDKEEVKELINKVYKMASILPCKINKTDDNKKETLTIILPNKTSSLIIDGNVTDGKDTIKDLVCNVYQRANPEIEFVDGKETSYN